MSVDVVARVLGGPALDHVIRHWAFCCPSRPLPPSLTGLTHYVTPLDSDKFHSPPVTTKSPFMTNVDKTCANTLPSRYSGSREPCPVDFFPLRSTGACCSEIAWCKHRDRRGHPPPSSDSVLRPLSSPSFRFALGKWSPQAYFLDYVMALIASYCELTLSILTVENKRPPCSLMVALLPSCPC